MKIHIDKKQIDDSGCFGKKDSHYNVTVHYELNDEERALLEKHPDVKSIKLMEVTWKGIEWGATIEMLTDPVRFNKGGGYTFPVASSGEMLRLESEVNESAKKLKNHLLGLKDSEGSSVTEI